MKYFRIYDILIKISGSKIEEIFDFTTLFTTIGRKDMPRYTFLCHGAKMVKDFECSRFQIKLGISWYNFA